MNFLSCRYLNLQLAVNGYQKTGVPLIIYDTSLKPLFYSVPELLTESQDDIGLYVFIPKLLSALSITLEQGLFLLFYSISFFSFLCASIGFFLYYKTWIPRFISIIGTLCLLLFALSIGDLYIFYVIPIIALLPFVLGLHDKFVALNPFLFLSGLIISICHYMRSHSGLPILTFLIVFIFFSFYDLRKRIILICSLILGLVLPIYYFEKIKREQLDFVTNHIPSMQQQITTVHPFWHTMYLGFSFLKFGNPDNIRWDDRYGLEKAKKQKPKINYHDSDYELILKKQVFDLVKSSFSFVLLTLFAKLGILLFYTLKYANLGLLAGLYIPLSFDLSICFFGACASALIFPLLSIPEMIYSLSFISLIYIYSIMTLNNLIEVVSIKWKRIIVIYFIFISMLLFVPIGTVKLIIKNYVIGN